MKYSLQNAQKELPTRRQQDNKTHGGKGLVIAGSKGLYGSAILTCLSAARSGTGYTYLLTDGKFPVVKHPDFLVLKGRPEFSKFDAIAIGPGFKSPRKIKSYLDSLLKQKIQHVVLDAEALNCIAKTQQKLLPNWIVTPHEGELSRILKVSSDAIRNNRRKYVLIAQKKLGCIVVLKGHKTLVADKNTVWEIQSGNPALAKAGTGDVLTGIILGLLCQGLSSVQAATLACYIHGLIADNWVKSKKDTLSLIASDLVDALPKTIYSLRSKR